MKPHEVLIVGAGPVGLSVANFLSLHGIQSTVIEQRDRPNTLTRGIGVTHSSLMVFHKLGILEQVLEQAKKVNNLRVYFCKKPLFKINFKNHQQSIPYFVHAPQVKIERILIERCEKLQIPLLRSHKLIDLKQDGNGCQVTLETPDGILNRRFKYAIGCDGGKSTVGKQLHIQDEVKKYGVDFAVVDCIFKNGDRFQDTNYYVEGRGYLMIVPMPDGVHRIVFSFPEQQLELEEIESALIEERLLKYTGQSMIIEEIRWKTMGSFYHRIARQAIRGNVLLAGDALHQFSPIGGLNMNIGIQDAENLSWRLARVLHGTQPAQSLMRYEFERLQVCRELRDHTEMLTQLMTDAGSNQEFAKQFTPSRQNIHFFKRTLPHQFSGCTSSRQTSQGSVLEKKPAILDFLNPGSLPSSIQSKWIVFVKIPVDEVLAEIQTLLEWVSRDREKEYVGVVVDVPLKGISFPIEFHVTPQLFEIYGITKNHVVIQRPDDYILAEFPFVSAKETFERGRRHLMEIGK